MIDRSPSGPRTGFFVPLDSVSIIRAGTRP
jgi:hypothetical protein